MKRYPVELRRQIMREMAEGLSETDVILKYGVSLPTIRRWQQKQEEIGICVPGARPGPPRLIDRADEEPLLMQLRERPNGTLAEHCDAWERATGIMVSASTMSRALRRLGWRGRKGRRHEGS